MRYFALLLACVIAIEAHHGSNENYSIVENLLVKSFKIKKIIFLEL